MEDMTKQQLIMLVLFVSFVTALVTGIVTVSLVNQAPGQITQTIQKVVERAASIENPQQTLKKEETRELEFGAISRDILIEDIVRRTYPAVVSIIAIKEVPVLEQTYLSPFSNDDFLNQFFPNLKVPQLKENGTQKKQISSGTGFFVSKDGFLITNKHVVEDKIAEYSILMNDGATSSAKVLSRDPLHDVAILQIEGNNFSFISLGDSNTVQIGHTAIAIGNALGEFQNTVSIGVISGLKRNITATGGVIAEELTDVIQTDAAINPGNSGGPLLNLKGEVVGLNSAIAQGAQNIGFAIPINQIKKTFEDVKKYGRVIYPYLGVRYEMVAGGAVLTKGPNGESAILEDSPAFKAGLKEGDKILKFGDKKIEKTTPLTKLIQEKNVGEKINITIFRSDSEFTVEVTLEERKD